MPSHAPHAPRPPGRRLPICLALTAALSAGAAPQALAATRIWDGHNASSNWSSVAFYSNWSGFASTRPANGDSLIFQGVAGLNNSNDYTALSVAGISFASGAGAFSLNGKSLTSTGNVINRSSNLQTINLGIAVGANQTWDGGTPGLSFNGVVNLGNRLLTLVNKVTINNDSTDLWVGSTGTGTLSIQSGSAVNDRNAYVGDQAGGNATATVTGAGSTWASSTSLYVGTAGRGTLNIRDLGKVTASTLEVGAGGIVNLDGGTLEVASAINAGYFNWSAGTLGFTGDTTLGEGLLGASTMLGAGQTLAVRNTLSVGANGVLDLNGGQAQAGALNLAGRATLGSFSSLSVGGDLIDNGTLTVGGGSVLSSQNLLIGQLAGSTGTATVAGAGSRLTVTGRLLVGDTGNGTLNVEDGAVISMRNISLIGNAAGRRGTVTVTGAGSQLNTNSLHLGRSGNGTLNVEHGGVVNTLNDLVLGYNPRGTGTVTVSGAGSQITAGNMFVGYYARSAGTLNIASGGGVSTRIGQIGSFAGSTGTVTVSGAGSLWTSSAIVILGYNGAGTVNVERGGAVNNPGDLVLGYYSGSTGTATVTGAGSRWNSGNLFVGYLGSGTLNIRDLGQVTASALEVGAGGIVKLAGGTLVTGEVGNAGQIQLAGGTLESQALLNDGVISGHGTLVGTTLTNNGQLLLGGGNSSLHVDIVGNSGSRMVLAGNSSTTFHGTVDVRSGAELQVAAGSAATFLAQVSQRTGSELTGTGSKTYAGGLLIGASPGFGSDAGSVGFAGSNVYLAEIGGITGCTLACASDDSLRNSSYDRYFVGGLLTLGGTLKLTSWNGFVAQAGQRFDLLDWGSESGSFASIDASGLTLAAGTRLDFSKLYTSGEISVASITAVPEPESWAMLLAGLGLLSAATRARRKQAD
jgi:T5SS/PEP-CTERM-associated repeat protein